MHSVLLHVDLLKDDTHKWMTRGTAKHRHTHTVHVHVVLHVHAALATTRLPEALVAWSAHHRQALKQNDSQLQAGLIYTSFLQYCYLGLLLDNN